LVFNINSINLTFQEVNITIPIVMGLKEERSFLNELLGLGVAVPEGITDEISLNREGILKVSRYSETRHIAEEALIEIADFNHSCEEIKKSLRN